MITQTKTRIEELEGFKTLVAELDEIEDKVVNGYTLADAMREGARHTVQLRNGFVDVGGNRVCALSAATLAVQARRA